MKNIKKENFKAASIKKVSAVVLSAILSANLGAGVFAMQEPRFMQVDQNLEIAQQSTVRIKTAMNLLIESETALAELEPIEANEARRDELLTQIDKRTKILNYVLLSNKDVIDDYINELLDQLIENGQSVTGDKKQAIRADLQLLQNPSIQGFNTQHPGFQGFDEIDQISFIVFTCIIDKIKLCENDENILAISNLARAILLRIENHAIRPVGVENVLYGFHSINSFYISVQKTTLDFFKNIDMDKVLNDTFGGAGSYFMGFLNNIASSWQLRPIGVEMYRKAFGLAGEIQDIKGCAKLYDSILRARELGLTENEVRDMMDKLAPIEPILDKTVKIDNKKLGFEVSKNIYFLNSLKENGFITAEDATKLIYTYLKNQTITDIQTIDELRTALSCLDQCLEFEFATEIVFDKINQVLDLLRLQQYQDYNFDGFDYSAILKRDLMKFMKHSELQIKIFNIFANTNLYQEDNAKTEFIKSIESHVNKEGVLLNIGRVLLRGNIRIGEESFRNICNITKIDQAIEVVELHNLKSQREEQKEMKTKSIDKLKDKMDQLNARVGLKKMAVLRAMNFILFKSIEFGGQ